MNSRTPNIPPVIDPVPAESSRPLWSVMIPTYNCISYLKETVESVLVQDPGVSSMQIEVVDDFSTDGDVEGLVRELGRGRVGFHRQPENRGSLRNFETCIRRSQGQLIHILHGDDLVKPGFYNEMEMLFSAYPNIGAAITGFDKIDEHGRELNQPRSLSTEHGILENWLFRIAQKQLVQPPAVVVKRAVYEKLGSFFAVHYGEDWEMWVRIAANYPVACSPKNLALYRIHSNNITSRSYATGQNVRDLDRVIDIVQAYLPNENRKKLKKAAKTHFSQIFAKAAHASVKKQKNYKTAITQVTGALKMDINAISVSSFLKIYAKYLLTFVRRK